MQTRALRTPAAAGTASEGSSGSQQQCRVLSSGTLPLTEHPLLIQQPGRQKGAILLPAPQPGTYKKLLMKVVPSQEPGLCAEVAEAGAHAL